MADGAQPTLSRADKVARDIITLPSGVSVFLHRLDIMACRSKEDCLVLAAALEHKIGNLENQFARHREGFHSNGTMITLENPADPSWGQRARYALSATKLQLTQTRTRMRHFEAGEVNAFAVRFVAVARQNLNPNTFESIEKRARETIGEAV